MTTWVLVLIALHGVVPTAELGGVFNSLMECFEAREVFMEANYGFRPTQALCISRDVKTGFPP